MRHAAPAWRDQELAVREESRKRRRRRRRLGAGRPCMGRDDFLTMTSPLTDQASMVRGR